MKFIIHNLLDGSAKTYEGDAASVERQLEEDFPWATAGNENDLDHILWTIDHQQFRAVEMLDKSAHPFLKDMKKAIADLPPGKIDEGRDATSYTHLLPENLRKEGYEMRAYDRIEPGGMSGTRLTVSLPFSENQRVSVGNMWGMASPNNKFRIVTSEVDKDQRHKGIGLALYEAALRHAKDKYKSTHVVGGAHSSLARRMHQKIAEKHGLKYEAQPNIGYFGNRHYWMEEPTGSFDHKWGPYEYTLKDEPDIEDIMGESLKKEETLVVPQRYMRKHEPNLNGWEEVIPFGETAMEQSGLRCNLARCLDAAAQLTGARDSSIPLKRALEILEDDAENPEEAALRAYGIPVSERSLISLNTVLRGDLEKNEALEGIVSYKIAPARPEATTTADAVQRGIDSGYLNPVKLSGKHSKGSMLVKDPETKKVYLLKPGSGRNSPALGVSEVRASQSEREAAFYHVAEYIGLGDVFPRADLILVNNHQTAALELLPLSYHNLGTKKKEDKSLPLMILEPYRANGTLFKWSFIDYILGNPDRHSQNMMVDKDNRTVRLIDHGSAMAGHSFAPATDENSFIPYYLRAWTGRKFTEMTPEERYRWMPGVGERVSAMFDEWVANINEHHIAEILQDYNIDPSAILDRIAQIRAMPGPKWAVLNKLWAGAI